MIREKTILEVKLEWFCDCLVTCMKWIHHITSRNRNAQAIGLDKKEHPIPSLLILFLT
jgi:hypothetical protein